ncbi:MAG: HAMP domain-containing histidine kinase [Thermoleophilia bacterium]|nr:HAMP domain-containing histidine kinase [Thermoleophilia bacterium]
MRRLPQPSSLRLRLLAVALGAVGLGLAIATAGFFLALRVSLLDDATSVAQERAEARASLLALEGGSLTARDEALLERLDSDLVWVVSPGGAVVRGPDRGAAVRTGVAAVGAGGAPRTVNRLRLAAAPLMVSGRQRGTVVAAVAMRPYDNTMHAAKVGAAMLVAFVLTALAAATWWVLRAALDPVARMTRDAEAWGDHDLDRRFGLGPPRDELTGLAATLDGLLERIAGSLRHERHLTAEISHELRTPLARIAARAELGARDADPETAGAFAGILRSAEQMRETLTALLAAGRAAGDGESSDIAAAVERVADAARPEADAAGVELRAEAESLRVAAGQALVERALAPLVDNAVRHARRRVDVAATVDGRAVAIDVTDDGPGVAPDDVDAVFAPGVGAAGGAPVGTGLGLPLARRLARAAGGDVTAESGDGGRFRLTLPAARAPAELA